MEVFIFGSVTVIQKNGKGSCKGLWMYIC